MKTTKAPKTEQKLRADTTARIKRELADRIESLLPLYPGVSFNAWVEQAVAQMVELIETPRDRRLDPPFVSQADGVRDRKPLNSKLDHSQEVIADRGPKPGDRPPRS
jgi:hypothetical protein